MCRIGTVLGVLIVLLLVGTSAAVMQPVPYFSQCDSRWGRDKPGGDGPTICSQGCALTSAAMVMAYYGVDTDPQRLNEAIGRGGSADMGVAFGEPDDLPVIGDWDGDGGDNIGLYRPGSTTGVFYRDIDNDGGTADIVTPEYGDLGDIPIAGDWNGDGDDNIGVYRPETGEFFMDATVLDVLPSKTIYVDGDFDDNPSEHRWDTIQEGVDDAADGDTVVVSAGEYVENVDVDKSITLEGAGAEVVTVTAAYARDHVFEVTADYVNISGFMVTGGGGMAGIRLGSADHCHISDNNASNNTYGVLISYSNNNTLKNNTMNSNNWGGICICDSSNNTLQNNIASNNSYHGIYLLSNNNTLKSNTMSGNRYNFGVYGGSLSNYIHDIDTSNTVDEKPIYYLVDQRDKQIIGDAGFVVVVNSTNITVKDLTLTNNAWGVLFAYTEDSRIENVSASNNRCGIILWSSSNNTLTSNTMSGNEYNFGVWGYSLSEHLHNIDIKNMVDGKPIYYLVDQQNTQITHDAGFVGVVDSTNITVKDLTLTNNSQGVLFAYTENSRIKNVNVSNNTYGIHLYSSSNNIISGGTADSNTMYGIYLCSSNNNTLVNNTASSNNVCGINMYSSNTNILYHNNLLNDSNARDYSGINQWDSGSEGNYYSDYIGTDPDGDGIGEDPHPIPGGNSIDRYPLMHPWTDTPQNGDLNGDDQITPADATIALQIAAGGGSASCDAATLAAADVSGDGSVTSLDALMILQAAAGTPTNVITWYSYEEGMEIAGAQNKPVMIEVYTVWCKWCKEMDRVIYTDPDVIDLADQFVCIKIDADKRRDLAARYNPAGGVPTTVFIRSDDTEVHRVVGYPQGGAEVFIQEMMVALSNA